VAASKGNERAKKHRGIMKKQMSPNQIEEGKKLSKELHRKIYN
jgi:hypothetical protein